jgi:hypothetical protein
MESPSGASRHLEMLGITVSRTGYKVKPIRYGSPSQNERISEYGSEQCLAIELKRQAVFDQMAALLRQDGSRDDNDQTLKELIDNWAQAEVDDAGLEAKMQLERLLKQHHDFGEELMDVVAENLPCD